MIVVKDVDSGEKFDVPTEMIEEIRIKSLGVLTPQGLLDRLPMYAGSRGKNGKKRTFIFDEEWSEEKKKAYDKYNAVLEEQIEIGNKGKESDAKIAELTTKLDELNEALRLEKGVNSDLHVAEHEHEYEKLLPAIRKIADILDLYIEDIIKTKEDIEVWR